MNGGVRPIDDYSSLGVDPAHHAEVLTDAIASASAIATPLIAPEVTPEQVAVIDNGESLRPIPSTLVDINAYRSAGWPGVAPRCWVRGSVADRLATASSQLPAGLNLGLFDGWRSMCTVRALWDHYYGPGSTLAPGYVADPDHPRLVPPHHTGGAVDVTLCLDTIPLNLGTPFDSFTADAAATAFEHTSATEGRGSKLLVRDLRRLLHRTMSNAGFTPMAAEWWHFSFGDQCWASAHGHDQAPFGATDIVGARPSRRPLTAKELSVFAEARSEWHVAEGRLRRVYEFKSHAEAIEFMVRGSWHAEHLDHHPDWSNSYRTVRVALRTHDRDAVTPFDTTLADLLDLEAEPPTRPGAVER